MTKKFGKYLAIFLLICFELGFAQARKDSQILYPYEGEEDSTRKETWMERNPLNFNKANFRFSRFRQADFKYAKFYGQTDFSYAEFNNRADFRGAQFDSLVDFRDAQFDSLADFERAIIGDKFFIGSRQGQKFDFTRTVFSSNAKLILCELVELDIQTEKIKYIDFDDELSYNLKRLIIDNLKDNSFNNNSKAQFELEYTFAKSIMYQEPGDEYIKNKWYQVWKWPKRFLNTLYYLTMGLGYRPFRLAWWVLGTMILFTVWYYISMREQINRYIIKDEKKQTENSHPIDLFINCLYFSSALFFTFRFKKDILTSFERKERWIIVSEYLIGFLVYIAFLTLAKSGSILHNLKSLFVG